MQGFEGILVRDRKGGYNDDSIGRPQSCWAHLIRNPDCIAGRSGRTNRLSQRLAREEPVLWTFPPPEIALTKYAAEMALRPYLIWRKFKFFNQSNRGNGFRPQILSLTESCKRFRTGAYQILGRTFELGLLRERVTVPLPIPGLPPAVLIPTQSGPEPLQILFVIYLFFYHLLPRHCRW